MGCNGLGGLLFLGHALHRMDVATFSSTGQAWNWFLAHQIGRDSGRECWGLNQERRLCSGLSLLQGPGPFIALTIWVCAYPFMHPPIWHYFEAPKADLSHSEQAQNQVPRLSRGTLMSNNQLSSSAGRTLGQLFKGEWINSFLERVIPESTT